MTQAIAGDTSVGAEALAEVKVGTERRGVLRAAMGMRRTQVGVFLVVVLVLTSVLGPVFAPHAADAIVGVPNGPPTRGALLGTDYLGQDVLSRFLDGGLSVLVPAFIGALLGVALGVAIGLGAALSDGVVDSVVMRALDVILAFPPIMLALVAVTTTGPSNPILVAVVAVTTAPRVARVARGAAQPVIARDFIASAEALGMPRWRIVVVEVLPNTLSPLLVEGTLRLTYAIGLIASLAFLGLATNPNSPNWGLMIQQNQVALLVQPWGVLLPIVAIALLTVGTGFIGDGVARASAGIDRTQGAA